MKYKLIEKEVSFGSIFNIDAWFTDCAKFKSTHKFNVCITDCVCNCEKTPHNYRVRSRRKKRYLVFVRPCVCVCW